MYSKQFPHLFEPLKIKGQIIKNRVMSAPNMLFHTVDGRPTDYYIGYMEHKARGGAAIVNLGEVSVGDGGCHTPEMVKNEDNLPLFAEMTQSVHEHGALCSAELTHGGMRVKSAYNKCQPMGPVAGKSFFDGAEIKAMTVEDMEHVCKQYADTTEYCLHAGFDTVLLHFGHGWLPAQFMSPIINTRTDEFGGSWENRCRFPMMILKAVRDRVGPKQLICIRISGSERNPNGFTIEDTTQFLEKAQEYVDLVEVSTEDFTYCMTGTYRPLGVNTEFSEYIKKSGRVHIPVYSIGAILYPEQAEEIIASGKADGVSMSRALIADPYLPEKALAGKADEITPCVRCLNCTDSDNAERHFKCSVNPLIGREHRLGFGENLGRAKTKRKILIVGGGPGGMEAAIVAAQRGHDVTLAEKTGELGGLLKFTDHDNLKHDLHRYKDFLVSRVKALNIKILLNTEVTPEFAADFKADDIIVATGSSPVVPTYLKGVEKAKHATAIYFEPESVKGDNIVIIGGGLIGVEAGLHLRSLGKNVTVLELLDAVARDARGVYAMGLFAVMKEMGLKTITGAKCQEVTDDAVIYEKDGKQERIEADSVFYAVGMKSEDELYFDLCSVDARLAIVGDAKKVGKITGAVHDGFFAALDAGKL